MLVGAALQDKWWSWYWIFDGAWEIGYFAVIAAVAYLWRFISFLFALHSFLRPNENNERYAYSIQLDENLTEEMGNVELSDDDEIEPTMVGGSIGTLNQVSLDSEEDKKPKSKLADAIEAEKAVDDAANIDLDDD